MRHSGGLYFHRYGRALNGFSTKIVIFTNIGIGSVDVTGIFANGGNSGEFTVDSANCNIVPIVPNGTCQAIVRFLPVAPVGATKSSARRFTYEADNTNVLGVPADVQLQGLFSPALPPVAAFDPTGFPFGNMIIGQTSAPKLFTFTNTGTMQITLAGGPTTLGNNDFPLAGNPQATALPIWICSPANRAKSMSPSSRSWGRASGRATVSCRSFWTMVMSSRRNSPAWRSRVT